MHALDVASTESVEKFAAATSAGLGDAEVVVCNAGLLGPGSLLDAPTEQLAAEFDVNVLGAHRLVRVFGAGMVERQRGDLVFVSSDTALRARPFMRGYSATKSGLEGLVEALQMELEGSGVRASVVRPGPTWSEMGSDWDRRGRREGPHRVGQVGPRPALPLPQGDRDRRRDRDRGQRAPRGAHQPGRREPRSTPGSRSARGAKRPTGGQVSLHDIPEVSTVLDDQDAGVPAIIKGTGHLPEMRVDPIALFHRVREECGDIGRFRLADKQVVLVTGAEANEAFFRAPESVLDQAAAYPFMTPIFGKGVVFDASPEERQQMLKNQALRGDMMRGHAQTIEAEIRRMVADWGDEGEIDLLDFFAELTIYTTSSCLIGKPFRDQLDGSFAEIYHRLEHGTDAIAYVDPYADIENFRIRDQAREELVAKVQAIIAARVAQGEIPREDRDLLDVLIAVGYDAEMVTGIFISMMFAGHHTSSGTASWAMIELLRNPDVMADVVAELDALYADGSEVSFQALRSIPVLEAALKETLRLHPPLVILMRLVQEDFDLLGRTIPAGTVLAASPRVSNRIEEDFPKADQFDPGRYVDPRQEDLQNRWTWIPFGAGKHRCVGNAFAMMQMKAIFSVILRDFSFEPVQPLDSYRDDFTKMVIQLAQPARVKYTRRQR